MQIHTHKLILFSADKFLFEHWNRTQMCKGKDQNKQKRVSKGRYHIFFSGKHKEAETEPGPKWRMISEGLLKNLGNTSVLPMVTPLLRVFVTVRGRSQTTFTRFDFFLITYPPSFTFSMVWKFTKRQFFWPPTPLLL